MLNAGELPWGIHSGFKHGWIRGLDKLLSPDKHQLDGL
jgi:hypothetical protein